MKAFPTLTKEERNRLSKINIKKAKAEYQEFKDKFSKGICYLCNESIKAFHIEKPCIHWLLRPKGFNKRHLPLIYTHFDYHKIQPYLRWVANTESPFKNINDLVEEKGSNKIVENTIKYKNIEWSFSSSQNDFKGIPDSKAGSFPHYHFQMRMDNKPFIDYSNFHIPFTDYDLWFFKILRGEFEDIRHTYAFGMGMQGILDEAPGEKLLESMQSIKDENKATFHLFTIITADKRTKISGDEIADIVREHNETGVPLAQLIKRLKNVRATTVIEPGRGVPDIAARKGGRRSKKK